MNLLRHHLIFFVINESSTSSMNLLRHHRLAVISPHHEIATKPPRKRTLCHTSKLFVTQANSLSRKQTLCHASELFVTQANSLSRKQTLCHASKLFVTQANSLSFLLALFFVILAWQESNSLQQHQIALAPDDSMCGSAARLVDFGYLFLYRFHFDEGQYKVREALLDFDAHDR